MSTTVNQVEHLNRVRIQCEAALCVALSIALGNLRILELPQGGSISLASLPILAFALIHGFRKGFMVGLCAGFGNMIFGGTIIHPIQILLDYGLASAALGFAGVTCKRSKTTQQAGILVATSLQLLLVTISGVVFFGQFLPKDPWLFSFIYNLAYIGPEALLAVILTPKIVRAYHRAIGEPSTSVTQPPLSVKPKVAAPVRIAQYTPYLPSEKPQTFTRLDGRSELFSSR